MIRAISLDGKTGSVYNTQIIAYGRVEQSNIPVLFTITDNHPPDLPHGVEAFLIVSPSEIFGHGSYLLYNYPIPYLPTVKLTNTTKNPDYTIDVSKILEAATNTFDYDALKKLFIVDIISHVSTTVLKRVMRVPRDKENVLIKYDEAKYPESIVSSIAAFFLYNLGKNVLVESDGVIKEAHFREEVFIQDQDEIIKLFNFIYTMDEPPIIVKEENIPKIINALHNKDVNSVIDKFCLLYKTKTKSSFPTAVIGYVFEEVVIGKHSLLSRRTRKPKFETEVDFSVIEKILSIKFGEKYYYKPLIYHESITKYPDYYKIIGIARDQQTMLNIMTEIDPDITREIDMITSEDLRIERILEKYRKIDDVEQLPENYEVLSVVYYPFRKREYVIIESPHENGGARSILMPKHLIGKHREFLENAKLKPVDKMPATFILLDTTDDESMRLYKTIINEYYPLRPVTIKYLDGEYYVHNNLFPIFKHSQVPTGDCFVTSVPQRTGHDDHVYKILDEYMMWFSKNLYKSVDDLHKRLTDIIISPEAPLIKGIKINQPIVDISPYLFGKASTTLAKYFLLGHDVYTQKLDERTCGGAAGDKVVGVFEAHYCCDYSPNFEKIFIDSHDIKGEEWW